MALPFGLYIESGVCQYLRKIDCQVIADPGLDHRLKTDCQIVEMDGNEVSPIVCVQITTRVENAEKINAFLRAVRGVYCRFLYVEISWRVNQREEAYTDTKIIAQLIKKIVKTLLRQDWREDRGRKNPIFLAHICYHQGRGYKSEIRRLRLA